MTSAISINGLSYRVGEKEILRDVSFTVEEGEFLTIVGPNGAGKTTLLRCIDRIITGATGRIDIYDRPVETFYQKDLAKLISYVPQSDGRSFPFTVEQFVMMARYPYSNPFVAVTRQDRETLRELMQLTDVSQFADRPINTLSGGERQRVYIVGALAQGSRIILLDEPTTFLDYHHQAEIRVMLRHINQSSGRTIVAVTHDVNLAALESDRIVAMRGGRVVFYGDPAQLMRPETLEDIYGGKFTLVRHPRRCMPMIVPNG